MRVFLYGTLLDRAVLARRSGRPLRGTLPEIASLRGWRRVAMTVGPFPTLRRQAGGRVVGALHRAAAADAARLAAYEGPRYRLIRVAVATPRGQCPAWTWIAAAASRRPWKG